MITHENNRVQMTKIRIACRLVADAYRSKETKNVLFSSVVPSIC